VELDEQAKIYGKRGKPLTKYEKAVNKAAVDLANSLNLHFAIKFTRRSSI
jgi:hypothetical protein